MSCISAATSTPVGPPPQTTNDSSFLRSSSMVCCRHTQVQRHSFIIAFNT
jgi:hypothetical protein